MPRVDLFSHWSGVMTGNLSTETDGLTRFSTGAVRGTDANSTRYDLLSSFAIDRVGSWAACRGDGHLRTYRGLAKSGPAYCVVATIKTIGEYVDSEPERRDHLLQAAWWCLSASHFDREGTDDYEGGLPPRGVQGYAEAMAEGAAKYAPRNYESGIPLDNLLNHAARHLWRWLDGDREEDDLGHAAWNLMTAVHMMVQKPEMAEGMRWYQRSEDQEVTESIARLDHDNLVVLPKIKRDVPSKIVASTQDIKGDLRRFAEEVHRNSVGLYGVDENGNSRTPGVAPMVVTATINPIDGDQVLRRLDNMDAPELGCPDPIRESEKGESARYRAVPRDAVVLQNDDGSLVLTKAWVNRFGPANAESRLGWKRTSELGNYCVPPFHVLGSHPNFQVKVVPSDGVVSGKIATDVHRAWWQSLPNGARKGSVIVEDKERLWVDTEDLDFNGRNPPDGWTHYDVSRNLVSPILKVAL